MMNACPEQPYDKAYPSEFPPLPNKSSTTAFTNEPARSPSNKRSSRTITLPIEEQRRPALGEKLVPSEICRSVMKHTKSEIEMSTSALTKTITMVVNGEQSAVDEACKIILARLAVPVKLSIPVPRSCLPYLIGQGGKSIKGLMHETGARIAIPKESDEEAIVNVSVEGCGESSLLAKNRIEALIKDRTSHSVKRVDLLPHIEPFLIGPSRSRNDFLSRLSQELSVKLSFNSANHALMISGLNEHVDRAETAIRERHDRLRREVKQICTQVPKHIHKHLIGTKGSVLHSIEDSFKCHLVIPPPQDPSEVVIIYGLANDMIGGLGALMEKVEEFHEEIVSCPTVIAQFISHKHRDSVKRIEQEHQPTQIKTISEGFSVIGPRIRASSASRELSELIHSLKEYSYECLSIEIPGSAKYIIGKKGQGIERLEKEYEISILIDKNENSKEQVYLIGRNSCAVSSCRDAIKILLETVENEDTHQVPIDLTHISDVLRRFKSIQDAHPDYQLRLFQNESVVRIRGPKGNKFHACVESVATTLQEIKHQAIMHSYTVSVSIPTEAKERLSLKTMRMRLNIASDLFTTIHNDSLTLRGIKEEVDSAVKRVVEYLERLADFTEVSYSIPQNSDILGKLIGKGGKNVGKLSKRHSVDIRIEDGTIRVSGPGHNVAKCVDEVQEFIDYLNKNSHFLTVPVSSALISRLLAKQGLQVNALQEKFNCRISINRQSGEIRVEGEEEAIGQVAACLEQASLEDHSECIAVDAGTLNGSFSLLFRQWMSVNCQGVRFRKSSSDSLTVIGRKDLVESAIVKIHNQFVNKLSEFSVQAILIDPRHHGLLIGHKGMNVKRVCAEYNVSVELPKEGNLNDHQVVISGERVEEAIADILKTISEY